MREARRHRNPAGEVARYDRHAHHFKSHAKVQATTRSCASEKISLAIQVSWLNHSREKLMGIKSLLSPALSSKGGEGAALCPKPIYCAAELIVTPAEGR